MLGEKKKAEKLMAKAEGNFKEGRDHANLLWPLTRHKALSLAKASKTCEARELLESKKSIYKGMGAYWALRLQMIPATKYHLSEIDQLLAEARSNERSEKCGEFLCEEAHCLLLRNFLLHDVDNPSRLKKAKEFLKEAIVKTPQYGDSYMGLLRIYLRENDQLSIENLKASFLTNSPKFGIFYNVIKPPSPYTAKMAWDHLTCHCVDSGERVPRAFDLRNVPISDFDWLATQFHEIIDRS